MKPLLGLLLAAALAVRGAAAAERVEEGFGFSLVPNAFSSNPLLSMTAFTEVTDYGRKLAPATAAAPVYFAAVDLGLRSQGESMGGEIAPTPASLQSTLFEALAQDGYRPAAPGQSAGLILVYYWGSHHSMDRDLAAMFPERNQQYLLERAMLVGGRAYRREVANQMDFGYSLADRTPQKTFLLNQISEDVYFVVVSAYAFPDPKSNQRILAWRTTLTVNTNGVSMKDCLLPLVVTATGYFGKATPEPVAIHRRAKRGTVTLGPLHIVPGDVKWPEPPAK